MMESVAGSGEFSHIDGIKMINNIPYALGADAVQKVFEHFGIKKSKRAVYKFISKATWKKRVSHNGRSFIAVPIYEIERWIKKNYPIVWSSQVEEKNEEKKDIVKAFSSHKDKLSDRKSKVVEVIDDILANLNEVNRGENKNKNVSKDSASDDITDTGIFQIINSTDFDEPKESKSQSAVFYIKKLTSLIIKNPPSSFDVDTLKYIKNKLLFLVNFIDVVEKLLSDGENRK